MSAPLDLAMPEMTEEEMGADMVVSLDMAIADMAVAGPTRVMIRLRRDGDPSVPVVGAPVCIFLASEGTLDLASRVERFESDGAGEVEVEVEARGLSALEAYRIWVGIAPRFEGQTEGNLPLEQGTVYRTPKSGERVEFSISVPGCDNRGAVPCVSEAACRL
jgi:hypothetical protein